MVSLLAAYISRLRSRYTQALADCAHEPSRYASFADLRPVTMAVRPFETIGLVAGMVIEAPVALLERRHPLTETADELAFTSATYSLLGFPDAGPYIERSMYTLPEPLRVLVSPLDMVLGLPEGTRG